MITADCQGIALPRHHDNSQFRSVKLNPSGKCDCSTLGSFQHVEIQISRRTSRAPDAVDQDRFIPIDPRGFETTQESSICCAKPTSGTPYCWQPVFKEIQVEQVLCMCTCHLNISFLCGAKHLVLNQGKDLFRLNQQSINPV